MNSPEAVIAFRDAVTKPVHIQFDPDHQVFVVPDGFKILDARSYMPAPPFIAQRVELETVESFVGYVARYAPKATVFAGTAVWRAVLDYHEPDRREECQHLANLQLKYSYEGKAWLETHGKRMTHEELVRFLEDRAKEITAPPSADLFELLRSLNIRNDASFSSEISLDSNAAHFSYEENIRGTVKRAELEIPREFTVTCPLFDGMAPRQMRARLRYQVKESKLALWFEFADKDRLVMDAIDAVSAALKHALPEALFYSGSAAKL